MDDLDIRIANKMANKQKSKKFKKNKYRDMWNDEYGVNKKNPYKRDKNKKFHDYLSGEDN